MYVNFEQVHNYCERLVFEEVVRRSGDFQHFTPEMLGDVACVALNRMPVRYVRHDVDLVFYLTEVERHQNEVAMDTAITDSISLVLARNRLT